MLSLLRIVLLFSALSLVLSGQHAAAETTWECTMNCAMRASQSLFSCADQASDERCKACVEHRLPLCERCLTERCGIEDEEHVQNSCEGHRAGGKEVC